MWFKTSKKSLTGQLLFYSRQFQLFDCDTSTFDSKMSFRTRTFPPKLQRHSQINSIQTKCLKTNFDKFSVSNVEGTAMHINKHRIHKHWTDKHGIPKRETKLLFDWNENIYWSKILPPQYYRICFHISCIKHASITNISIVQMSDFQQNSQAQSGTDFLRNILYTLSH